MPIKTWKNFKTSLSDKIEAYETIRKKSSIEFRRRYRAKYDAIELRTKLEEIQSALVNALETNAELRENIANLSKNKVSYR